MPEKNSEDRAHPDRPARKAMREAMLGALVADAVAMPVHWYYDTSALDRDYPDMESYQAPRNPHPDSILWRSKYVPRNQEADILHDQARFWGQRGIHYHQFLPAGGNTLNFLLGTELYRLVVETGAYHPRAWLDRYVACMRTPGWHRDTYVEEYHRAFFDNRARGCRLDRCAIRDIHIGGLTAVPFLLAALHAIGDQRCDEIVSRVQAHLALTHLGQPVALAGGVFARLLNDIVNGVSVRNAIVEHAGEFTDAAQLEACSANADRTVVGRYWTSACYLPDSFKASLFLAWKYHDGFSAGVIANARCGGDNAHRGAVVGALLAAANGLPQHWIANLRAVQQLPSLP